MTVVGLSLGAKVAAQFTIHNPTLVDDLLLSGIQINCSPGRERAQRLVTKFTPKKLLPIPESGTKQELLIILDAANKFPAQDRQQTNRTPGVKSSRKQS